LSLIHSVKHLGKSIIIERNSHKSVYSACKISGINPIIINNNVKENGLYGHISAEDVKKAINENSSCIGAVITSPDYYGTFADIKQISDILKERGKLLFIDASHGAHLPFIYKDIYKRADAYICSAHKTLPALTPASFTAFNNISLYEIYNNSFTMFHSSSPSYPVLASIETAVKYMEKEGGEKLKELYRISTEYKNKITAAGYIIKPNDDFTKLVIGGANGFKLYDYLALKGLYCELADKYNILAMFTVTDTEKTYKKLYNLLLAYKKNNITENFNQFAPPHIPAPLIRATDYIKAYNSEKELIPLNIAIGRIAACDAGIFPPAYPLICCGDVITREICEFLLNNEQSSFGLDKGRLFVVK
jgi:lysine decarboxylase